MRKLLLSTLLLAGFVGAYSLWPVVSAFQIKQAVKAGDVATLERKVLWAPVRASLKHSIATLTPAAALAPDTTTPARAGGVTGLSLWSRIKAAAAPVVAESFIDRYVTPEGISQIQHMRQGGWRSLIGLVPEVPKGTPNAAITEALQGGDARASTDEPGALTKFVHFYQRLVRARFHSLSKVEFEIADKHTPERRYISQFELLDFEWKLASLRVVGAGF